MEESKNEIIPEIYPQITENLTENLLYIRKIFDNSADLSIREFKINDKKSAVISIDNMIEKIGLSEIILKPIANAYIPYDNSQDMMNYLRDEIINTCERTNAATYQEAFDYISSGFILLAIDGYAGFLAVGLQNFVFRGVSEPATEEVQRGSREGFIEILRMNMTMIRRRMKTPDLKFEIMNLGKISRTNIAICYLQSKASKDILNRLRKKLSEIDLEIVLETGYLQPFLEDSNKLFSSVGVCERPDTVCGKIAEGRIAILVDGTPHCLIVPFMFIENFQSLDDYNIRSFFVTFTRILKYMAFIISTTLPAFYVAIGSFHQEMFPNTILYNVIIAEENTPFSLFLEAIFVQVMYEIMRESGLRLPRPIGHVVGIVGGLIIGDSAVKAGLIGVPMVIFVAITAICSYLLPSLYEPIVIIRLILIILAGYLGLYGMMAGICVFIIMACSTDSFGVPYTSVISPFSLSIFRDGIFRANWRTLSEKSVNIKDMAGSKVDKRR